MKKNKGISLIVLVITIIVIIILAGAVILSLANNNPIVQANMAKFKSDTQEINSELQLWITSQYASSEGTFNPANVNIDNLNKKYNGQTISEILTTLKGDNVDKYQILNGKLTYVGKATDEINASKEIGVDVYLPYVKDGLLMWYDGIDNGGIGIHNDNTSANKAVWKDLSGNSNDANLNNFKYDTTSGWQNNYLKFDGINNTVRTKNTNPLNSLTFEICLYTPNTTGQILWPYGANSFIIYNNGAIYIQSDSGTKYLDSVFNVNNTSTTLTIVYNIKDQTAYYYQNSVLKTSSSLPTNSAMFYNSNGLNIFADYTGASQYKQGNVFEVRLYNKALSQAEVSQNYALDKSRFGI